MICWATQHCDTEMLIIVVQAPVQTTRPSKMDFVCAIVHARVGGVPGFFANVDFDVNLTR